MLPVDIINVVLLCLAFCFSAVELGFTAHVVQTGAIRQYSVYNPNLDGTGYGGYEYGYTHGDAPSQVKFLLFCACWSVLTTMLLLLLPPLLGKCIKRSTRRYTNEQAFGFASLCLNSLSMVFWIAGFGALAHQYAVYGGGESHIARATLAFGILAWVTFLALVIIDFLTTIDNVGSNRLGHKHVYKKKQKNPEDGQSKGDVSPLSDLSTTSSTEAPPPIPPPVPPPREQRENSVAPRPSIFSRIRSRPMVRKPDVAASVDSSSYRDSVLTSSDGTSTTATTSVRTSMMSGTTATTSNRNSVMTGSEASNRNSLMSAMGVSNVAGNRSSYMSGISPMGQPGDRNSYLGSVVLPRVDPNNRNSMTNPLGSHRNSMIAREETRTLPNDNRNSTIMANAVTRTDSNTDLPAPPPPVATRI